MGLGCRFEMWCGVMGGARSAARKSRNAKRAAQRAAEKQSRKAEQPGLEPIEAGKRQARDTPVSGEVTKSVDKQGGANETETEAEVETSTAEPSAAEPSSQSTREATKRLKGVASRVRRR
jgi:hypothetical protein